MIRWSYCKSLSLEDIIVAVLSTSQYFIIYEGGYFQGDWFCIDDGPYFTSVETLVDHYVHFADGMPCRLQYPIRCPQSPLTDTVSSRNTFFSYGNVSTCLEITYKLDWEVMLVVCMEHPLAMPLHVFMKCILFTFRPICYDSSVLHQRKRETSEGGESSDLLLPAYYSKTSCRTSPQLHMNRLHHSGFPSQGSSYSLTKVGSLNCAYIHQPWFCTSDF